MAGLDARETGNEFSHPKFYFTRLFTRRKRKGRHVIPGQGRAKGWGELQPIIASEV